MENDRSRIIMVDDDITNLIIGKNALVEKFDVFTAPSGTKLFQLLEKLTPDLILLDIEMPEKNGYEIIIELKSNENYADIPIIFLTSNIDPDCEVKGLSLGAIDYITKPFSRELLLKRLEVHLLVEAQRRELKDYSQNLEKMVSKKTQTVLDLQNAILKTVAELVESRDNITGGHIERTQEYLSLFIDFLINHDIHVKEFVMWDIHLFIMSSQLHDVGKISIKDNILMKPGKLTDEEFEEMKKHTVYGHNIMEKIEESTPENTFLKHAKILADSHHERWDGTGYPLGLKGRNIPLQGRLMAIVDVYDALTNDRPYKKAYAHEEAVEIIRKGRGAHFDPVLADIFLEHEKDFKSIAFDGSIDKQKNHNGLAWKEVSQTAAAIMDARTGMDGHMNNLRRNLEILINALLQHDRYKDEVSSWDTEIFLLSAQLHDFGKMAIEGSIPASHAEALTGSCQEKWDGSGYPLGLKGNKIPLQERLMSIIGIYNAFTSDRADRKRMSHKEAVQKIKSYSETYFDPELVDIFLEHEKEFNGAENCT